MAEGHWAPTQEEAALLSEGSAIVYMHDGLHEVVRLDAFPKELAAYQRQCERQEAAQYQRDVMRKSAARLSELMRRQANTFRRGVKISRKLAKAKGLL